MPDIPHDEFELGVEAQIADAVLAILRADTDLAAYFAAGGGIVGRESDVFFARETIVAPMLAVAINSVSETRSGESQTADLETMLSIYLFLRIETNVAGDSWLRSRIFNRVKALLQTNAGVLTLADGTLLNVALTRFQQLSLLGRLVTQANNVVVAELRALFFTAIDEATREPVEL